jgi:hypothetical protein
MRALILRVCKTQMPPIFPSFTTKRHVETRPEHFLHVQFDKAFHRKPTLSAFGVRLRLQGFAGTKGFHSSGILLDGTDDDLAANSFAVNRFGEAVNPD